MKKIVKSLLITLLALGLLVGCEDATANISDKNTVLLTIGNQRITKGDMYKKMLEDDAANSVINKAYEIIANKEIETTDEIKKAGQEKFDNFKSQLEDEDTSFIDAIKDYGYESEEAFLDYCITLAKEEELNNKYVSENFDDLFEKYKPVKARMMYFDGASDTATAHETAEQALAEVKAGADFAEVAAKYGSDATLAKETLYTNDDDDLDSNVILYLFSAETTGLSGVLSNANVNGFYIVQITNMNKEQLRSDFSEHVQAADDFDDTVANYYFSKYNFTIYDIDIYNMVKENYSAYLVQSTGKK